MGIFGFHDALSSDLSRVVPSLVPIGIIGLWRWAMFAFRVAGWLLYRPRMPTAKDKYSPKDVTVIVPTIDYDAFAIREALASWIANGPAEIIFVTIESNRDRLESLIDSGGTPCRVIVARIANKRVQLVQGVNASKTALVCFADDDAVWLHADFLKWIIAPFSDDERMGGVGSNQVMRPCDPFSPPTAYERVADLRLSGRMMEACASTYYDGSVSCLSGRTAVYATAIFDETFEREFVDETWGDHRLVSGDDKFMTRWLVNHNWTMSMQVHPKMCTLATTFRPDANFFKQVLRWTRNTWRSDFKSLFIERIVWARYPIQAVLMCDRMISPVTLLSGPILMIVSLVRLVHSKAYWMDICTVAGVYVIWITASRTFRMLRHFVRSNSDLVYLPIFIAYQYFFACLKLYALVTLNVTSWGTRASVNFSDDTRLQLPKHAFYDTETVRKSHARRADEKSVQAYVKRIYNTRVFTGPD